MKSSEDWTKDYNEAVEEFHDGINKEIIKTIEYNAKNAPIREVKEFLIRNNKKNDKQ